MLNSAQSGKDNERYLDSPRRGLSRGGPSSEQQPRKVDQLAQLPGPRYEVTYEQETQKAELWSLAVAAEAVPRSLWSQGRCGSGATHGEGCSPLPR